MIEQDRFDEYLWGAEDEFEDPESDVVDHGYELDLTELDVEEGSPESTQGDVPDINVYSVADAFQPLPPVKWYVEEVISEGSVVLLVGDPGHMKTYSMLALAICVAAGVDWAGRKVEKAKVLYIDEESGRRRLNERIQKIVKGYGLNSDISCYYTSLEGFVLSEQKKLKALRSTIQEYNPQIVIMDILADMMLGEDENSVRDVQPIFSALRKIAEEEQTAIIVIHHTNKNGGYRGSSAMHGAVDVLIKLKKDKNDGLTFEMEKNRDGKSITFYADAIFDDEKKSFFLKSKSGKSNSTAEKFIMGYLQENGDVEMKQLTTAAEEAGHNPESVRQKLYELKRMGLVERKNPGGNGKKALYGLT